MKKKLSRIIAAMVLIGMAAGGYLLFRHPSPKGDHGLQVQDVAEKTARTMAVETVSIREGTISEKLPAYGSIIPAPGARRIVSVPFESQVLHIFINEGQKISRGEGLIEIQPSPATMLEFEQASNSFNIEQENLRQVERRFSLKLATNEQLLKAKQTLEQAQTKLQGLKKQGIGGKNKISAQTGGLIKKINVQEGNIVPSGQSSHRDSRRGPSRSLAGGRAGGFKIGSHRPAGPSYSCQRSASSGRERAGTKALLPGRPFHTPG